MWLVPFCMGVAIGGRITLAVVSLLFVCAGLFCMRSALGTLVKRWARETERRELLRGAGLYAVATAMCAIPLLKHGELRLLAPLVALFLLADLLFVARRWNRSLPYELAGIVGLASAGPAALYMTQRQLSESMAWLWLFCLLYMLGTVLHVRLLKTAILRRNTPFSMRNRSALGIPSLTYFCGLILLLQLGEAAGWVPAPVWIIYLPSLLKVLYTLSQIGRKPVKLPRVGISEIFHAALFGVLGVWAMRA